MIKAGQYFTVGSADANGNVLNVGTTDPITLPTSINTLSSASVNMRTATLTTIITVPTGYVAFLTGFIFRVTNGPSALTGLTVPAVVSIGTDAAASNMVDHLSLTGMIQGYVMPITIQKAYPIPTAGTSIKCMVNTVGGVTVAYACDVIPVGILVPQ